MIFEGRCVCVCVCAVDYFHRWFDMSLAHIFGVL